MPECGPGQHQRHRPDDRRAGSRLHQAGDFEPGVRALDGGPLPRLARSLVFV